MYDDSPPEESHGDGDESSGNWKRRSLLGAAAGAMGGLFASGSAIADPYGGSRHSIPGRIEAENYDTGGQNAAYYDTTSGNSGGAYRSDDVDIEAGGDNYNVGWIETGEWLRYSATIESAGTYTVTASVASAAGGGSFNVEQNAAGSGGNVVGSLSVPDTGGWQSWTTVSTEVDLDAGDYVIAIYVDDGGFNLDWLDFAASDDGGGGGGGGGDVSDPYPGLDDNTWELTWNDEFDQGSIDTSTWTFEVGGGCGENQRHNTDCTWGNEEEQYYTDGDNAWVQNDRLIIEAREELAPNGENPYTSARLNTAGSFEKQYGRIDVRARLPETQGLWPAIWMLGHDIGSVGWPSCGEIDIMELLGHTPTEVHGTVHGPGYSGGNSISGTYGGPDFTNSFHDFTVTWYPDAIKWFVDGNHYHTVTQSEVENAGNNWVFQDEFFVILNVAVGGLYPGYPDSSTQLPQRMEVEYVRVWDWV